MFQYERTRSRVRRGGDVRDETVLNDRAGAARRSGVRCYCTGETTSCVDDATSAGPELVIVPLRTFEGNRKATPCTALVVSCR